MGLIITARASLDHGWPTDAVGKLTIGPVRPLASAKGIQGAAGEGARCFSVALAPALANFLEYWMTYHNHVISKRIVQMARARNASIVMEELAGIRDRSKMGKRGNRMMASWAFRQLVSFVAYKAALAGVAVQFVDPRGTSKTCSRCGSSEKRNRKTQADFCCKSCGLSLNADLNAARNIGSMAAGYIPVADGSVAPRMAPGESRFVQAKLSAS